MNPHVRRVGLLILLVAPALLFANAQTRWADILASPFKSWAVAAVVGFMGFVGYGFAASQMRVTARGLLMGWSLVLFISLVSWTGASLPSSVENDYEPPQPAPGALSNKDRAERNYLWYTAAIGTGVLIAVRLGRARWEI
jgi:hypothetical protein